MMSEVFLTDSGEGVVVCDGDEQYYYSDEEYVKMYGEDAKPEMKPEMVDNEYLIEIHHYYEILVEFLGAVGSYQHLYKLGENAEIGIFPVLKVARDYGHEGANYDIELEERRMRCWRALNKLEGAGFQFGLPAFSQEKKDEIVDFVKDTDRRKYIRDAARRAQKSLDILSIEDLMHMRINLERKKKLAD